MTGVVTAIIRKREGQNGGFGFIRDENGDERFFHVHNLIGGSVSFERLTEGARVTFTPITLPAQTSKAGKLVNGLRADKVSAEVAHENAA